MTWKSRWRGKSESEAEVARLAGYSGPLDVFLVGKRRAEDCRLQDEAVAVILKPL